MTRIELVRILSLKFPTLSEKQLFAIVHSIFEQITLRLELRGRIEIRGFGTFSMHRLPARTVRNPKTGLQIPKNAKYSLHFKPAKALRLAIAKTI